MSLAPRRQEIWLPTSKVVWLQGAERCYRNQQTIQVAGMRKKEGRCLFFLFFLTKPPPIIFFISDMLRFSVLRVTAVAHAKSILCDGCYQPAKVGI